MRFLSTLIAVAFLILNRHAQADEPVADARTQAAVSQLAQRGLLTAPDSWNRELGPGRSIDGEKVGRLLITLADALKPPVKSVPQAIEVLTQRGVIGSATYWNLHAAPGNTCDGKNVAEIVSRVAARLPVIPPDSVRAKPLTPTPPEQIKPDYDLVIAGAGTGGFGVAMQAARMGCSVLLIDETDWIGGQMNAAAVTSMDEGLAIARERGLYRELCGHIWAHYQPMGINPETAYGFRHPACEPRVGQQIFYTMLGDAKGQGTLDVVFRSTVIKALKKDQTITGAEIQSTTAQGTQSHTVACRILVDATEWGDVIPLTGARYRAGNCLSDAINPRKLIQHITWTAVVKQYPKGVPPPLLLTAPPPGYAEMEPRFLKTLAIGDGELAKPPAGTPWSWARFIGYRAMPDSDRPNDLSTKVTRTHLNFNNDYPATVADLEDPAKRRSTNRAAILRTLQLLYYIQTKLGKTDWSVANDEGFDSPYNRAQMDALTNDQPDLKPFREVLYHFSVMAYARESRRIVGLHTLVAHEIERKPGKPIQFPTTIALADYAVDLHGSMTKDNLELDLDHVEDIPKAFGERGLGPFAIPFESFIPEKIDGFLPAEKNLSQSRMASGATRLQPSTMMTGQAVGAIAALAIKNKIPPRKVDPKEVQKVLVDAGCTLSIKPVQAPWGTPEWKAQQLKAVQEAKAEIPQEVPKP